MKPEDVGTGMIDGGTSYVWMAYVACWIVLTVYALHLTARASALENQ